MIKILEIENFKSIKHLRLDCRKINLFIGEPNTGKSNILETIGVLSHVVYEDINRFVRFQDMKDLFYAHLLENKLNITFDEKALGVAFENGVFRGRYVMSGSEQSIFDYGYKGEGKRFGHHPPDFSQFKFYRFEVKQNFPDQRSEFLLPPDGRNLLSTILTRKDLRTLVKQIFGRFGLALVFEPHEGRIKVQKQLEDIVIEFPYWLISETLQRIVFYLTAIHSNQNSVLAFEEPEAHAFPYYTKYLAEVIASDKSENQYFISTHNPYLLLSLIEKTPKNEIAIFDTSLENYQTKVKTLTEDDIKEVLEKGIDLFFDIERFLS